MRGDYIGLKAFHRSPSSDCNHLPLSMTIGMESWAYLEADEAVVLLLCL